MRALSLALVVSLLLTGGASAATKKKHKDENPPTAKPDATLVVPDTTPPPPSTGAPTRPVEAQPIGTTSATAAPAVAAAPVTQAAAPQPVAPAPAPSPPAVPVLSRAEACLRNEAPRAARADASTKLAVDLLIDDLCGAEVERAALYTHNLEALARFTPQSERAAAGLNGARVDPESGEIVNPPAGDVSGALQAGGVNADLTPPATLRRYAAELVLNARAAAEPKKAH